MAKDKESKPRGKIRVFLFELEGSDETLLEGVKSIAGAVSRTFGNPAIRTIVKTVPQTLGSGDETVAEEELEESDETFDDQEEEESSTSSSSKSKRSRKYTTPKVVTVDLTSGDMPLKVFCEQKKPNDHRGKYMVIAAWLKEYRNIDDISIDHIYTGYRAMSWTAPKDMGGVFRDAKGDGYFDNGTKKGNWKINHIGLDRILNGKAQGN